MGRWSFHTLWDTEIGSLWSIWRFCTQWHESFMICFIFKDFFWKTDEHPRISFIWRPPTLMLYLYFTVISLKVLGILNGLQAYSWEGGGSEQQGGVAAPVFMRKQGSHSCFLKILWQKQLCTITSLCCSYTGHCLCEESWLKLWNWECLSLSDHPIHWDFLIVSRQWQFKIQTQRTNLWSPCGKDRGRDSYGVWNEHVPSAIFKMDSQHGSAV